MPGTACCWPAHAGNWTAAGQRGSTKLATCQGTTQLLACGVLLPASAAAATHCQPAIALVALITHTYATALCRGSRLYRPEIQSLIQTVYKQALKLPRSTTCPATCWCSWRWYGTLCRYNALSFSRCNRHACQGWELTVWLCGLYSANSLGELADHLIGV